MWVVSRVVAHGEGVRNQFAAQPLKHPAALLIVLLSLLSSSSLISGQPTTGHVRLSRNQATFAQAKAHRTQEAPGRLQAQVLADELTAGIRLEEDGQHARGMTTRKLHSPSDAKHSWPGFIVPDHERRMGQAYRVRPLQLFSISSTAALTCPTMLATPCIARRAFMGLAT